MTNFNESLSLITAVNALIGYCEALEPGNTVTHDYVRRLNEHYIPQLKSAMETTREPVSGEPRTEKGSRAQESRAERTETDQT